MKFVPEHKHEIAGFWMPSPGDTLSGVLHSYVQGKGGVAKPFYVLVADQDRDDIRVESRERTRAPCRAGDRIGVSSYRNLQGLHNHVGRRVDIQYTGDKELRTGVVMKVFDVDVDDHEPGHARADADDTDSEVPF